MKIPDVWKSDLASLIRKGEYLEVINEFYAQVPDAGNGCGWVEQLEKFISGETSEGREEAALCLGIAALGLFIRSHWTGPPLDKDTVDVIRKLSSDEVRRNLVIEDAVLVTVKHPELLSFALKVFEFCIMLGNDTAVAYLWQIRGYFIQQQILDEISPALYDKILASMRKLPEDFSKNPEWILESIQIYMYYMALELAQRELARAQEVMGFSYLLKGVLGKRTKFQQNDIPQLVCLTQSSVHKSESGKEQNKHFDLNVPFNDDVLLQHMLPTDDTLLTDEAPLRPIEYAFLLAAVKIRMKSMSNHVTSNEENKSIVDRLFRGKAPWAPTITALLLRMDLAEKREKNVAEALGQIEWIIQEIARDTPNPSERLDLFFISYLPSINDLHMTQASHYMYYNDCRMALDIYEKLQKWQLVIQCLIAMNERNRAEVLIRQQLTEDPSNIALLCYLGDITENPEHYAKALEVWGKPSVRVHRHWGLYFYNQKKFKNCIEHFEKSLELNRFQPNIWLKLGWSAISEQNYKLGAKSYKQYCMLESDDREAWDNLAHCYDQLGESEKAIMILKESLKVDMSFWKTWDSLTVSYTKLKQFDEAIKAYQNTLKLNPKYVELAALGEFVNAFRGDENTLKKNAVIALFHDSVTWPRPIDRQFTVHMFAKLVSLYAEVVKGTDEEYEALGIILDRTSSIRMWERENVILSVLADILDRFLLLHVEKGLRKEVFRYAAQPVISTVLAYDPGNQQFLTFKEKMENVLTSSSYDLSALNREVPTNTADGDQL